MDNNYSFAGDEDNEPAIDPAEEAYYASLEAAMTPEERAEHFPPACLEGNREALRHEELGWSIYHQLKSRGYND
jgi:hypothetical protein